MITLLEDAAAVRALPKITVSPIQIPSYRNDRIWSFSDWYRDNEALLSNYYSDLQEVGPMKDFLHFASLQHDITQNRVLGSLNECSKCHNLGYCRCDIASNE